jgi:hypothetical protein
VGLAFELVVTRSRAQGVLETCAAFIPAVGLTLAAAQVGSGPTRLIDATPATHAMVALALGVAALAFAVRALFAVRTVVHHRAVATGVLVVDAIGDVALRPLGDGPACPMALRRGWGLPGLSLLVLAPCLQQPSAGPHQRSITLMLGRDAVPDESWRRLQVWLQWMERGRHGRSSPVPDRS